MRRSSLLALRDCVPRRNRKITCVNSNEIDTSNMLFIVSRREFKGMTLRGDTRSDRENNAVRDTATEPKAYHECTSNAATPDGSRRHMLSACIVVTARCSSCECCMHRLQELREAEQLALIVQLHDAIPGVHVEGLDKGACIGEMGEGNLVVAEIDQ
jgi:hypothetical protein